MTPLPQKVSPKTPYPLGRIPSPFDFRDWNLKDFLPKYSQFSLTRQKKWDFPGVALNQGDKPFCVGFSGADFGINLPIQDLFSNQTGIDFYKKCKVLDGEPGQENGSSMRTLAKVLRAEGIIKGYAFAPTISIVRWWLLNRGPMPVGTVWTDSMFTPDKDNIIHVEGEAMGGHAYLLNEVKYINGVAHFGLQNSWGYEWGNNGGSYISMTDFQKLMMARGECIAAVEVPKAVA
jgi:hypothetical protein